MTNSYAQSRAILVAIDDDESSRRVVNFVNRFFVGLDVDVIGMNVGEQPIPWMPLAPAVGGWSSWPPAGSTVSDPVSEQQRRTRIAADKVESSGLASDEIVAALGDPVRRICELATERAVDLVVVGDGHPSAWRRLLDGSVTEDLRHRSPCPVLVVP